MQNEVKNSFKDDEHNGEKLISNIRLSLALIYSISTTAIAVIKAAEGTGFIPWRSHIATTLFLLYSLIIFIHVRKKKLFQIRLNIYALPLT